ncbi:heavy metal translocating P-type ATPase [Paludisphaera sp.]|uniref:heavy metal translocating P-type ATPase n=1 Tax=Paludisphaera sp. TaxID=2017432 RepID=UPI00301DE08D
MNELPRETRDERPSGLPAGIGPILGRAWGRRHAAIAVLTTVCIAGYLASRYLLGVPEDAARWWLWVALAFGGGPLVVELAARLLRREFGSDLLAGISIVAAVLLGEYLAGTLVVLMLSGGEALEALAVARASSVLDALARRMPSVAHRKGDAGIVDVALEEIRIGDVLVVLPHEACPVDGVVVEGRGGMDEAYLTGEPYRVSKSVGSEVLSGAINGEAALSVRAVRLPVDSRYASIMRVMRESRQRRPRLRRLGDQLGAFYTPLALAVAAAAWAFSGDPIRFLAVLVIATPCPLLIAIPVAIIGSISLAARHGIVVRDPAALERIGGCRTMIFDKTGTLTYGKPTLVERHVAPAFDPREVLRLAACLERYSKHPLAMAVVGAAEREGLDIVPADSVHEPPGEGLTGSVAGRSVRITSSPRLLAEQPDARAGVPPSTGGLECVVLIDGRYAATYRFRDEPRAEGAAFVGHLAPMHGFDRVMLVSGDRSSEVEYLGRRVGITELRAGKSPEEKLDIVREETARQPTLYVGDGVNDAPAMIAATVGVAIGQHSEVTAEAAEAVIMDDMLGKVDVLLHIGRRMRRIALQSAIGGMALSVAGMLLAALGYLPPVAGAVAQEVIDVVAVANALRASWSRGTLADYQEPSPAPPSPDGTGGGGGESVLMVRRPRRRGPRDVRGPPRRGRRPRARAGPLLSRLKA